MKSRIFLLIIVLLSTLQISFANNKIDNLFKKTKELPNAEYYTEDLNPMKRFSLPVKTMNL